VIVGNEDTDWTHRRSIHRASLLGKSHIAMHCSWGDGTHADNPPITDTRSGATRRGLLREGNMR
jgi:hypothetical protein